MTSKNDKTIFKVSSRSMLGKAVSRLRSSQLAPANIYGLKKPSQPVEVDVVGLTKLYEQEGDTGLIFLQIDNQPDMEPVLIDEVQTHPVSGEVLHVAFRRVNLKKKILAEVPVELVGEADVPGTTVVLVRDSLEVRALPADFPENFEVDVSILDEVGKSISIADLKFDRSKVELVLSGDVDESSPIAILQEVKEEPEEEPEEDVEFTEDGEAADQAEDSREKDGQEKEQDKKDDDQDNQGDKNLGKND